MTIIGERLRTYTEIRSVTWGRRPVHQDVHHEQVSVNDAGVCQHGVLVFISLHLVVRKYVLDYFGLLGNSAGITEIIGLLADLFSSWHYV